jgi:hypothetical protein
MRARYSNRLSSSIAMALLVVSVIVVLYVGPRRPSRRRIDIVPW